MTVRMLVVDDGEERREVLINGRLTVGRDPRCHISHPDPLLSRRHAEFVLDSQQVKIRDLGSRNGILVNGTKVPEQVLAPGDRVQLGHLHCVYEERTPAPVASGSATPTSVPTVAAPPRPAGPVVPKPDRRRRAPVVLDARGSDDPTFAPGVKQPARSEDLEDTRPSLSRPTAPATNLNATQTPTVLVSGARESARLVISDDLIVREIAPSLVEALGAPADSFVGRPLGDLIASRLRQMARGNGSNQLSLVVEPADANGAITVTWGTGPASRP